MAVSALRSRQWFKLICGASQHHLPLVTSLAEIYSLAGADCIDVAADAAVVRAALRGVRAAGVTPQPLLMASFNDGADPHFRKVTLAAACPSSCPQPCVAVCPTAAIEATRPIAIQTDLCFGCGRCLPLCPADLLRAEERLVSPAVLLPELVSLGVNAIEIHTHIGREIAFEALWQQVQPWLDQMQVVSVSFNDGQGLRAYLAALLTIMQPLPAALIWQVDGRPMSGDIGVGTTRATLNLAEKVLAWQLPGYVQLAGGTNDRTWSRSRSRSLPIAGIAYGSYARQLVSQAPDRATALSQARQLIAPLKVGAEVFL